MNIERYNRQIILPNIGTTGQQKLLSASALIVGVGGLGSIIALYLTAAGVGRIGLIDGDNVTLSNLQRQIIYQTTDIGQPKVVSAKKHLLQLNPEIKINSFNCFLDESNINEIASQYDFIIDGLDNIRSRYLIDSFCKKHQKPFVYGAVSDFVGQVGVFNFEGSRSYSDLFPDIETEPQSTGIFGVLPGIIGSLQANEVIKIITGSGVILNNKLLEYDIRTNEQRIFNY